MDTKHLALPRLEFRLLRAPVLYQSGVAAVGPASAKARALLYYLVTTGQTHTRATLAGLLWGDRPDAVARSNLRKVLLELGATLPDYLVIDRHYVGFRSSRLYWADAIELATQLGVDSTEVGAASNIEDLRQALALYEGDFLEGFTVHHAPDFETWMLTERARLRELMLQGLERVAEAYALQGDLAQAITYARRYVTLFALGFARDGDAAQRRATTVIKAAWLVQRRV